MAYNYGNDIGYLGNTPGIQPVYNNIKRNQVYQATHNSNDERTSYNARSYISFSFGGTQIEDLNLIACVDGDRMERQLTANFHDLTSSYDVVDGQFYWGTYYDNNQMNFYLATDGMTQENLEDFIRLFAPGSTRELILAEHPNRAIMARVATPPIMNVIPFQEKAEMKVNTIERNVITALYKGDIHLELIMDDPFWYSKINILGHQEYNNDTQEYEWTDNWMDVNNNISLVYDNEDALRIIYEDRIPSFNMLKAPCFLGNGLLYRYNLDCARADYAIVETSQVDETKIAFEEISDNMDLEDGESTYLYYSGTAPEKPIIKFTVNGTINDFINQEIVLDFYCNDHQQLRLKTPLIYQQYEQVKNAFREWDNSINTYRDVRLFIRANITHPIIKKWSLFILDYCQKEGKSLTSEGVLYLPLLFYEEPGNPANLINIYELNFQTGELTCYFQYRDLKMLSSLDHPNRIFNDGSDFFNSTTGIIHKNVSCPMIANLENINNLLYSKPIILQDRNHFSEDGNISFYSEQDKLLSYKITNNSHINFNNISIKFSNRYY